MQSTVVGRSVPRKEGRDKVTGRAKYVDDLKFPGMLHGSTVRSPVARGRIRAIHFEPGVPWEQFTVVTSKDIPGTNAVAKRIESSETVVLLAETLAPEEREPYVRAAATAGRPRHIMLFEPAGIELSDEDKAALGDLRRRLTAGELGEEGFQTSLRLAGRSIGEVKRLDFQRPSRDD